ncbi:Oidioi.mRNA.OKI2018_I69.chr1.g1928.t1.cds [Oikopleura dioica]|uniref:Oidioi.mRNA.OKI2018_I69.chr1.g1928.t1.cds n=1 Tax=Oikopleura dioica TaxID=34765 RepID=A0ABN7SPH3_OIKDI|nr:Oidioi.mRNA.OKI2018_I69.chr1.g1928.t1.cds [Oikopleura dioica]
MYPNTAPPQYQQQRPYPAVPFAGAPGYGTPPPAPNPAPAYAPPPPPAPSTPQPVILNIQQNAPSPTLAAPAPIQPALSEQALPQRAPVPVETSSRSTGSSICMCCCVSFVILIIISNVLRAINGNTDLETTSQGTTTPDYDYIYYGTTTISTTTTIPTGPRVPPSPPFPLFDYFFNIDHSDVDGTSVELTSGGHTTGLEYTVSTFIDVYVNSMFYTSNIHMCNKIMSHSSDGLTFEFTEFATELGYDFVYLQGVNGIQYFFSGPETPGSFDGMRLSTQFDPIQICFKSDHMIEDTGFLIRAIDGYEPENDIDANWPDKVSN